jgi:acyl-CoA oxidase
VALVSTAGGALAKAATIAARYSCVRLQGFAENLAGGGAQAYDAPERQILDYQNQLYRVMGGTADAYAIKMVSAWLLERRKALEGDDAAADDLPEVHSSAAGLKSLCTVMAANGIEDLRRCCGGHGYLMSSGIAPLEADFKGPNVTAEGDTYVLLLQLARFLMKAYGVARAGDAHKLSGLTECLRPLADPAFDPVRDAKPPPFASANGFMELGSLTALFRYRALVAVAKAGGALEKSQRQYGPDAGWNRTARLLSATSNSHLYYFMLSKFVQVVEGVADEGCKQVLGRLCALFAVRNVLQGEQWLGLLTATEAGFAEDAAAALCEQLRPDAVALTDAFDFPDRILNSALGRKDGNVYEALYREARRSSINVRADGSPILRPPFFDVVEGSLDLGFLALANGPITSSLHSATTNPPAAKL